jgi:hypothetical protein
VVELLYTLLMFFIINTDIKTPSGGSGSPDSTKENKMDSFECEQQQAYSIRGSKLGSPDVFANAIGSPEFDKSKIDTGVQKKGNCRADMAVFIGQKGLCGPPASDDRGIMDSDSYDVHSTLVSQIPKMN